MRARLLDAIIDACVLLDRLVSWRWVARLFLWAWGKRQKDGVLFYHPWDQQWYRAEPIVPHGRRWPKVADDD